MELLADVAVHHNNHVRFIFPLPGGKLGSFCSTVKIGPNNIERSRGFLFANYEEDRERALFTVGDWDDSERLIQLLTERGFGVHFGQSSVPMSNGPQREMTSENLSVPRAGRWEMNVQEFRYDADEVAMVRGSITDYTIFLHHILSLQPMSSMERRSS